jgi:hypothetical protein
MLLVMKDVAKTDVESTKKQVGGKNTYLIAIT